MLTGGPLVGGITIMGGGLSTSPDLEIVEGLDDGEKALVGLPIMLDL